MKKISFILFGAILAAGCSENDTSVGFSISAVSSTGSESSGDLAMTDDGSVDYTLKSAQLHLRNIELDLPDGQTCADIADTLDNGVTCEIAEVGDDSDKLVIAGPFDVDLVSGTASPSLETIVIPAGTYKRIDFRVEDNNDDVSFSVNADFLHNGETHTLQLSLDFNEDIRVERNQGITVDANTSLVAKFVVNNWLAGIDLEQCIDDNDVQIEDKTVVIDDASTSGSCSDIENTIKDNMKNSGQLDKR